MAEKKTIPEVIAEANRLSKNLNRDGSVALIAKALARYPNNDQLIFELARHKFINARYKGKKERETLLKEAEDGFILTAQNTENENRRAWAYHFITTISIIRKEYDKARSYNRKIIGGRGLYPKVDRAIIEMTQYASDDALHLSRETIYQSIFEYSLMLPWVLQHLLAHNQPKEAIREAERAVHVLCEFNDTGLFYNELSECCESIARAHAITENFESCLVYLEQAYEYADMQDKQETGFVYNVYGIMGEMIETEEKLSAKRELARVLLSDERGEYNPIREEERFKKVIASCSG